MSQKNRTGEIKNTANGQQMKIIAYRGAKDVDIQFEDGTIVKHRSYVNFKNGEIKNPNLQNTNFVNTSLTKVGLTNLANVGLEMEIIAYRGSEDLDILFADGIVVKNKRYNNFKLGSIKYPTISRYGYGSFHNFLLFGIEQKQNKTVRYFCTCKRCERAYVFTLKEMMEYKCVKSSSIV